MFEYAYGMPLNCITNVLHSNIYLSSLQVNISLSVFLFSIVLMLEKAVVSCAFLEWVDFHSKPMVTVAVGGYSCVVGLVVGGKLGCSSLVWVKLH